MAKTSFYPGPYINAFANAEAFLAKGRKKVERPIGNNTILRRIDADTIAVILHATAVVTYHRDSTFTIYGGGWNTPTTKSRIRDYSPARPWSLDGEWVVGESGNITAPRVQKCRKRDCKGKGTWIADDFCSGPSYWGYDSIYHINEDRNLCTGAETKYTIALDWEAKNWTEHWESRHEVACKHGKMESHFVKPCKHGEWEHHKIGESTRTCYGCNGTGVVDYGSKPIPITVSPYSAYKVDANGKFLGETAKPSTTPLLFTHTVACTIGTGMHAITYEKYMSIETNAPDLTGWGKKQFKTDPYAVGKEARTALTSVLPAMNEYVAHPITHLACSVAQTIVSLNDTYKWPREQIADWLDTLDVDLRFPTPTQED